MNNKDKFNHEQSYLMIHLIRGIQLTWIITAKALTLCPLTVKQDATGCTAVQYFKTTEYSLPLRFGQSSSIQMQNIL